MKNRNPFLTVTRTIAALAAITAVPAFAETVTTRIYRIEAPAATGLEHEVLATADGRVYYASPSDRELLARLESLAKGGVPARLETGEDGERIVSAEALSADEAKLYQDEFDTPQVEVEAFEAMGPSAMSETGPSGIPLPRSLTAARALGYEPSILASAFEAQRLFDSERELKHKSQCYERAHVWSYELEQSRGIKSMKVFMFFTERFRHRFWRKAWGLVKRPYKWWFHVAPFVYAADDKGAVQEYVLDREFLPSAVKMNDWTFEFIGKVKHANSKVSNPTYGEALCQDAASYRDYSKVKDHPRYCVLRKVPMYYFQPLDLDALDCRQGRGDPSICQRTVVSSWRGNEVKWAYKNTRR